MKMIDDAWLHFHRSWAIRASLAFGAFTGVLMGLPAFVEILNPLVFMGLCVLFNVLIIPLARIVKQKDVVPPPAAPQVPA
jgi:hypothetical protein